MQAPPLSAATSAAFAEFNSTLLQHGLRDALAGVLRRSDYRFIGIWRFRDGKANAAVHVDREQPDALSATEVPDTATYCTLIRSTGGLFQTSDAALDERLKDHPARDTVLTYHGVPLIDMKGYVIGTLCHYDLVPRDNTQIDTPLMGLIASSLALRGLVPPYPEAPAT